MRIAAVIVAGSLLLAARCAPRRASPTPQIASIVVTANQVDIDAGKLAAGQGRPTPRSRSSRS